MKKNLNKLGLFISAAVLSVAGTLQFTQPAMASQKVLRFTYGSSTIVMRANITNHDYGTSFRAYKTYVSVNPGHKIGRAYYAMWRDQYGSRVTRTVSDPETVRSYGWKANKAFICIPFYWKGENVKNTCHSYRGGVWTTKSS